MANPWSAIETDTLGEPLPLTMDQNGTWVYCSRDVWQNHILNRHPEIAALKEFIISALQTPTIVESDPEDPRVSRYYIEAPATAVASKHSFWLRVVVKYIHPPERNHERTGILSSAYLLRKKGQSR